MRLLGWVVERLKKNPMTSKPPVPFPVELFSCSIYFQSPTPNQIPPSPPTQTVTFDLHCCPESRVGGCCCSWRGFPTSFFSPANSKNLRLPVMSWLRNYSKLLPWETPYQEVQTAFVPRPPPLLDCYRKAAWKWRQDFWFGSHTLKPNLINLQNWGVASHLPCFSSFVLR